MNVFTVSLFYLMIPGVLMALIYDKYTQHQKWDSFRYVLMSIVFGITTYLVMQSIIFIYQFITNAADTKSIKWFVLSIWSVTSQKDVVIISPIETLLGSFLAIFLGLIAVFLNKKRTVHNFLVRHGISNKYGDDNVFFRSVEHISKEGDCFAYILLLDDKLMIHGHITYYNESQETQELGLQQVTVYSSDDATVTMQTNFLYVSKEFGKMMIFKDYITRSK